MRQPWESPENPETEITFVTMTFLSEDILAEESCPLVCPFQVGESYEYLGKVVFCLDVSANHSRYKWGDGNPVETSKKPWTTVWCWKVLNLVTAVLLDEDAQTPKTSSELTLEVFWNLESDPSLVKSLGGVSKPW